MDVYQNLISGDKPLIGTTDSCRWWLNCIIAYNLPIFNLKKLLSTPTEFIMELAKLAFLLFRGVQFIVIFQQLLGIVLDSAGGQDQHTGDTDLLNKGRIVTDYDDGSIKQIEITADDSLCFRIKVVGG